jgi:alpha,alpha-trehalase
VIEGSPGVEAIAPYVCGMLSDCSWRLAPRPEHGLVRPLLRMTDGGAGTFGGPDQIALGSSTTLVGRDAGVHADFTVAALDRAGFCLIWAPAESLAPQTCRHDEVAARIADTVAAWRSRKAEHDIEQG